VIDLASTILSRLDAIPHFHVTREPRTNELIVSEVIRRNELQV
jgi:hypothetical protein